MKDDRLDKMEEELAALRQEVLGLRIEQTV